MNQYGTNEVQLVIAGAKVLVAEEGLNPPDITGKFTFTLTGQNADGLTAVNDAAGNVTFDAITYTAADLEGVEADENNVRTAVFEYTVTETGIVDGIINDGKKTFTVTVTDDGKGHLTATPDGDAQFVFRNIYTVTPEESPIVPNFSFLKTLDGREMVEGEFQFQMTDVNGNVISTGTNTAEGTVVMSPITFSKPGTYVYLVSEVAGELGGITYDPTVFTMTAQVVDNSMGSLVVTWSVDNEQGIIFKNTYEPESTVVQFGALKLLEGRDLTEGEFEFELVNQGEVLATATNAADGSIEFEPIEFAEVGTYLLEIREVQGNVEGVTYDDFVCQIEVVVTDDLNGALQPEIEFLNGDPIFTNVYEQPPLPPVDDNGEEEAPEPGEPTFAQTNDATPFGFVVALAAAAAAVLAALRKRLA